MGDVVLFVKDLCSPVRTGIYNIQAYPGVVYLVHGQVCKKYLKSVHSVSNTVQI